MFWIIMNSFRRNRKRYKFFMVALTLAALVSSLGLSAVDVMSNMWRLPITAIFGGHIEIRTPRPAGIANVPQFAIFQRDAVTKIVKKVFPDALLTFNLVVPSRPLTKNLISEHVAFVIGREGGLNTWYLRPFSRSGEQMSESIKGRDLMFIKDTSLKKEGRAFTAHEKLAISQYDVATSTWTFSNAQTVTPQIAGTVRYPMDYAYTHLDTLQRLAQAPAGVITTIGIALPGVQARIDSAKLAELRTALEVEFPQLEARTVDGFAAKTTADLVPLRDSARRYLPIVLGIATMVVVATALAVVQSRRRELGMLRVIGMSALQVWQLFVMEATLAASLACAIGVLLSKTVSYLVFCARLGGSLLTLLKTDISLLPFGLSLLISVVVVSIVSSWAVSQPLNRILRGVS